MNRFYRVNNIEVSFMVHGYLTCALWLATEDLPNGNSGRSLDEFCTIDDFNEKTIREAIEVCDAFKESAGSLLDEWEDEQAGHDLWLTRNGHGAGFWDRGRAAGDELTKLAKPYGEAHVWECGATGRGEGEDRTCEYLYIE